MTYFLIIYFLIFTFIAWRSLPNAFAVLAALLPAYLIRFNIFSLPTTMLEGMILIIIATWFLQVGFKKIKKRYAGKLPYRPFPFQTQIILIVLAATVSIFVAPNAWKALGLWRAYFLEPILLFLVFVQVISPPAGGKKSFQKIIYGLGISALGISLFAIYQKITGEFIPLPMWRPEETRRVTSFYTSPNAVGLFLAPIAMIYFGILWEKSFSIALKVWAGFIITLSFLTIFFTKSEGSWLGLAAALLFCLLLFVNVKKNLLRSMLRNKKILTPMILLVTIALSASIFYYNVTAPSEQNKINQIIKDPANQNRIILWTESWKFLTDNPKNFIFGAGIFGFPQIQAQFRDPLKMEPLIYPHNIFLNFWLDIGFLGLISFIFLVGSFFKKIIKAINKNKSTFLMGLASAMITIIVHGLVDVPYFKNDLALLFWLIPGLYVSYENKKSIQK